MKIVGAKDDNAFAEYLLSTAASPSCPAAASARRGTCACRSPAACRRSKRRCDVWKRRSGRHRPPEESIASPSLATARRSRTGALRSRLRECLPDAPGSCWRRFRAVRRKVRAMQRPAIRKSRPHATPAPPPSEYALQVWTMVARRGMTPAIAARHLAISTWRVERIVVGVSRRNAIAGTGGRP